MTVDSLACIIHEKENGLSYTKTGDSLCNGYAQGVQQEAFERMVVKCPEGMGNVILWCTLHLVDLSVPEILPVVNVHQVSRTNLKRHQRESRDVDCQ